MGEIHQQTDIRYEFESANFGIFDKIPVLLSNHYLEKSTIQSHRILIVFISANSVTLARQIAKMAGIHQ